MGILEDDAEYEVGSLFRFAKNDDLGVVELNGL